MAGKKGHSGPPGNANAFRHGLSAIQTRRSNGALTVEEQSVRQDILNGLVRDKGGDQQISTATRILAEVIASDAAWLMAFNKATDDVLQKNQKAKGNPAALQKLDNYRRGLINSLSSNLQRFGFEKVAKVETLQEIIEEMSNDDRSSGDSRPGNAGTTVTSGNEG